MWPYLLAAELHIIALRMSVRLSVHLLCYCMQLNSLYACYSIYTLTAFMALSTNSLSAFFSSSSAHVWTNFCLTNVTLLIQQREHHIKKTYLLIIQLQQLRAHKMLE